MFGIFENRPLSVKPLPHGRHGIQVGRYHRTFKRAAFYSEPSLPCPCDPHGELAVRHALVSPALSLAVGGCGKPSLEKTPVQSLPVLRSGRATVRRTSHTHRNHKKSGIVEICYRGCAYRPIVALLAKVGCRRLPLRLKDKSLFSGFAQPVFGEVA
jgi:hypothetical protein